MVATTLVPLESADDAKQVLRLIETIDDHDDVQNVYSNVELSDDVLAGLEV
jgi:transcriptional/translational regulatory protein YebC/TACO1